jgi:hypothetical protein
VSYRAGRAGGGASRQSDDERKGPEGRDHGWMDGNTGRISFASPGEDGQNEGAAVTLACTGTAKVPSLGGRIYLD